ncbi:MAG: type II toxin-antitoxin system PemK/MazF family toxin [Proteobacteria bacterium]|nr:type II toxin-antitoxin system PemK/MazF family toxin [Pseudomonadota bacterium]MBU4035958.1 type II toxin-antitoxin system PemK/MazF family toxin [Pseudomonadota bacterium]
MTTFNIKRGEIYYAAIDPVVGSETGETRPVLIIQNDIGNLYSPTTIAAVITEYSEKKANYPICVPVDMDAGLKKHSIVNLSQIRTIDIRRLIGPKIAALPDEIMEKVDMALKNSLALK